MGLEWDPEGDAERRGENRARWWLTITVVLAILGIGTKLVYDYHVEKERREAMVRASSFGP